MPLDFVTGLGVLLSQCGPSEGPARAWLPWKKIPIEGLIWSQGGAGSEAIRVMPTLKTLSTVFSLLALSAATSSAAPLNPLQSPPEVTSTRRAPIVGDRALGGPLRVRLPIDNSVVGSRTIDVRGRLMGPLSVPGVQVDVNGISALVIDSGGIPKFSLESLELVPGPNLIVVVASAPGVTTQRMDLNVTLDPLVTNNVVVEGRFAYAARGTAGLGIMNLRTRSFVTVPPPAGSNRVDDVAVADGFLFLLDAAAGGRLSVMDLKKPGVPTLASSPVNVPIGPFAGVSAGGGRVVVSGGTGLMVVRSYGPDGVLGSAVSSIDLGVGQPDVLVSTDGQQAFVSTDFSGTVSGSGFGITTVALATPPQTQTITSRTGLPGSGFTGGFQAPANFPIEAALFGQDTIVAHGGGISRIAPGGVLVGTTPLGFSGVSVDVVGNTAFVVGTGRSLAQYDLTAPGAPQFISSVQLSGPGALTGVSANERFIAIAGNQAGLTVLSR